MGSCQDKSSYLEYFFKQLNHPNDHYPFYLNYYWNLSESPSESPTKRIYEIKFHEYFIDFE